MSQGLNRWKGRQRVSAAHLNEVWDLEIKRAGLPFDMVYRSLGLAPSVDRPVAVGLARVVTAGPTGQADYTDERYWGQDVTIDNDGTVDEWAQIEVTDVPPETAEDGGDDVPTIHTITNLPEWQSHSHAALVEGDLMIYFVFVDSAPDGGTANLRYVTVSGAPPQMVPAQLAVNSGAIGTQTTKSTWTYDATDIYGNSLGTNLSPAVPRENGTFGAASWGWGYMAPDGSGFVLVKAEEVRGTGGC